MARMYTCLILAASVFGAAADCTVPALHANGLSWSTGCVAGQTVVADTTCTIEAKPGYVCTSPGKCLATDLFTVTAPDCVVNTCTVPTIAEGAEKWSDEVNCVPGQTVSAVMDRTCNIVAKAGYTCVSPGLCKPEGKFEAIGKCTKDVSVTTTLTPWDSSASSSDELKSLDSAYSSSFKTDSSEDSSGSGDSSGSTASGSSGSYMQLWQWALLITALLCCKGAIIAAICGQKKKPKKKKPTPKPEPDVEPLLPPLVPLQPLTTSYVAPVAQTYAMPMAQTYAMPMAGYAGYPGYPGTVV